MTLLVVVMIVFFFLVEVMTYDCFMFEVMTVFYTRSDWL